MKYVAFVIGVLGLWYSGYLSGKKSAPPPPPTTFYHAGMHYEIIGSEVRNITKDSLHCAILKNGKAVITTKTIGAW